MESGNNENNCETVSGLYFIEGKQFTPKEINLKAKKGEKLIVFVDCDEGIFQLISSTFNHSILIPMLKSDENFYLHFNSIGASFSLISSEKQITEKSI